MPRRLDARRDLDPGFALDRQILERGVRSLLVAPLHAGEGIVGLLWYASPVARQYAAEHETAVARVADLIALALEHDRLSRIERDRRQRGEALEALLLPALASALDVHQVFQRLAAAQQVIPHDFLALGMLTEDRTRVRVYASPPIDAGTDLPEIPLNESMIATIGWEFFLVRERGWTMSQKCVEIVIGRLATDEEARRQLRRSPERWIEELRAAGLQLTAIEAAALAGLDPAACERFARTIDPRLQRASLSQPAAGAAGALGRRRARRAAAPAIRRGRGGHLNGEES